MAEAKEGGAVCLAWTPYKVVDSTVFFQNFPELKEYTREFPKIPDRYIIHNKQNMSIPVSVVMPLKPSKSVCAIPTSTGYQMIEEPPSTLTERIMGNPLVTQQMTADVLVEMIEAAEEELVPSKTAEQQ
jgi:hypothetical protein